MSLQDKVGKLAHGTEHCTRLPPHPLPSSLALFHSCLPCPAQPRVQAVKVRSSQERPRSNGSGGGVGLGVGLGVWGGGERAKHKDSQRGRTDGPLSRAQTIHYYFWQGQS